MRYAGQNYELADPAAGGRDRPRDARRAGARASPRRISACTASSPRTNRCSSSPSGRGSRRRAQGRVPAASPTPARMRRGAIIGRREVWLPEAGGFVVLPGLRPRPAAGRQPHRRSRDRRADGRDDGGAAWHDRARRSLSEPDPGGRMSERRSAPHAVAVDPITVEVIGSALSSITEEMGEALVRASLFHQHQGTPRLLDRAVRRPAARRSARPSTSRCISAASSASSRTS